MSNRGQGGLLFAWLPAVLYMGLIWALSSLRLTGVPIDLVPFRDKGAHFLEYAGLALLVAHAVLRTWPAHRWPRLYLAAVWIAAGWGLADELHQAFVPGRSADVRDLLADLAGASVGAGARLLYERFRA